MQGLSHCLFSKGVPTLTQARTSLLGVRVGSSPPFLPVDVAFPLSGGIVLSFTPLRVGFSSLVAGTAPSLPLWSHLPHGLVLLYGLGI